MRPRLVALVGPTAAGKTELAVALARELDAEIVSIDSRQVYRRLDVGTAKPGMALRRAVPHHMIDVVEPDEAMDAARFASSARRAIDDVLARGRRVLLCGGSGLYLRATTSGLCAAQPSDPAHRAVLQAHLAERGAPALHAELAAVDPALASRLAPHDAPRILRGLEVARTTGRPLSVWQEAHRFADRPYELLTFLLSPPVGVLERRIAERSAAIWRGGLLDETARVLAAGFAADLPPLRAIGYREAQRHLRGELDGEAAIAAIALATRQYAKRQRTWFRRLDDVVPLAGGEPPREVLDRAARFLGEERDAAFVS